MFARCKIRRNSLVKKPTVTKLTTEQAKLKLLDHASKGDEGAKELLELISPEAHAKEPKTKKKSA